MDLSLLDRARTIAPPGYNRWLIPPAALAVHLCIGEVYAFSVFKNPLVEKSTPVCRRWGRSSASRRDARPLRRVRRNLGRACGPAQGDVHRSGVLVERLRDWLARRRDGTGLAPVFRLISTPTMM
jgi:hypothetical protein